MPTEVGPRKLQKLVHAGFDRMRNFRRARLMFIRAAAGQYYDRAAGEIGTEPLNLIFNAIRVLVPNLVTNHPSTNVSTEFLAYRPYAELLGKALDFNAKQLNIRDVYRRWIVDAIFAMGIMKTGRADSGDTISFGNDIHIDPGAVYSDNVSFDNFVFDPTVRGDISKSAWMGDRVILPRRELLESGLYNNDLVMKLPKFGHHTPHSQHRAHDLSRRSMRHAHTLEDEVEVVELWVPEADAVVTVPGTRNVIFDDYLRVNEGPYSLLSFTPPVPDNPVPISMVGIWYDLHVMANRMVKKVLEQADAQKSVLAYKPSSADDAIEIRDAHNLEAVSVEDPQGVEIVNFGGQVQSNEIMIAQLQSWFNMMAANPQGVGGQDLRADSATEAGILQGNAQIGLDDNLDTIYIRGAEETRRRAFYMHTDPLINIPLVGREMLLTNNGFEPVEVQLFLTPEARRGDFLDFAFEFQPDSMQRKNSQLRLQQALDFSIRVMPAVFSAAQQAFAMGMPFNAMAYLVKLAKEAGIDWLDEVFFDPTFQQRLQFMMASGPQAGDSTAQVRQPNLSLQPNGQPGSVGAAPQSADTQMRSEAQGGAADSQRQLQGFFSPGTAN